MNRFAIFLNKHIGTNERAILVAWNGASCDLDWIYRLTQVPQSKLSLPQRVKYFLDPYKAIDKCVGCRLNTKHSGLKSYSLSSVYEYVCKCSLSNAHCSLIDAKAQVKVILSKEFRTIWRKKNFVKYVSEMFSAKDKRRIDALNEHNRAVNKAWKCGSQMDDYHLPDEYKYFGGSQGGIESKPSAHIIDMVTNGCSIVDLFLEYVSLSDVF